MRMVEERGARVTTISDWLAGDGQRKRIGEVLALRGKHKFGHTLDWVIMKGIGV